MYKIHRIASNLLPIYSLVAYHRFMSKRPLQDSHEAQRLVLERKILTCDLTPCAGTQFASHDVYRAHLKSVHHEKCMACHRTFPSNDILQLHINENHNPLLRIKQEQGDKIFMCFATPGTCTKVCATPKLRRLHMIDKHQYPRDFKFDVVNRGMY